MITKRVGHYFVCLLWSVTAAISLSPSIAVAQDDVELGIIAKISDVFDVSRPVATSEGIYFYIFSSSTELTSAWRMNLDGSGLKKILSFNLNIPNTGGFVGTPTQFVEIGSQVYSVIGGAIWRYNITTKSAQLIEQLPFSPMTGLHPRIVSLQGSAFIFNTHNETTRLYKVSEVANNASIVKTLPYTNIDGFFGGISGVIVYKNQIYFGYNDGARGPELWVTDGTAEGVDLFFELVPGVIGGNPSNFLVRNDSLHFSGSETGFSAFLYRSDGTAQNTFKLEELEGFPSGDYTHINNKALFYVQGSFNLTELWSYSGNPTRADKINRLYPLSSNGIFVFTEDSAVYQNEAYYGVRTSESDFFTGFDLWKTSGDINDASLVLSRSLPLGADALSTDGLKATQNGVFWSEKYFSGGMVQTTLYEDIVMLSNNIVTRLKRFPASSGAEVRMENSLAVENEIFIPVLQDGTLDLYSSVAKSKINISGALMILLEE